MAFGTSCSRGRSIRVYVYSQENDPNVGPLPTIFLFDTIPGITATTPLMESAQETIDHPDEMWDGAVIKKFKGWVGFTASVKTALEKPVDDRFVRVPDL